MYIKIYNFILRVIDLAKFNNFIFFKINYLFNQKMMKMNNHKEVI